MENSVTPRGTDYGTGWSTLAATREGQNYWMKISAGPGFPLSQIARGLTQGYTHSDNAKIPLSYLLPRLLIS